MSDATRQKHVSAVKYIGFELVGLEDSETITACECSVTPSGLTLTGDEVVDSPTVKQKIEGGVAGTDYVVRFHITTNLGYEDDFDYEIKVIA